MQQLSGLKVDSESNPGWSRGGAAEAEVFASFAYENFTF